MENPDDDPRQFHTAEAAGLGDIAGSPLGLLGVYAAYRFTTRLLNARTRHIRTVNT